MVRSYPSAGALMPFICYIHGPRRAVPHMEVLSEEALDAARDHARRLLGERPGCSKAEIYEGETLRETVTA